jgi:hypothetical protein
VQATHASAGTPAANWAAVARTDPWVAGTSGSVPLTASTDDTPRSSSQPPRGRVAAIDLIGGHPGGRHLGVQGVLQQDPGQPRLGPEPDLLSDAGGAATGPLGVGANLGNAVWWPLTFLALWALPLGARPDSLKRRTTGARRPRWRRMASHR